MYKLILICVILAQASRIGKAEDNNTFNGVEDFEISKRITQGLIAAQGQYSYVARLQIRFSGGTRTECSGVVLSHRHIITVAHCIVRPGDVRAESVVATVNRRSYRFGKEELIPHPEYREMRDFDVAILRKDWTRTTPFMTNYGTPPTLPDTLDYTGSAVVVGWGLLVAGGGTNFRPILRYATVTIPADNPNLDCTNNYGAIINTLTPGQVFICSSTSSVGTCAGDWGGPLLVIRNGVTNLAGLSLVRELTCGISPSGFIAVQPLLPWIRSSFPAL